MRFLIDANLPRRAAVALRELGHECLDARDLGLAAVPDSHIADYVRTHGLILVTRDGDFADVRNYPPEQYSGIVIMLLPDCATANALTDALRSFVKNQAVMDRLPGRLAIVEPGRIRLRPA
jgi:predicted nuclease of predicted toxin-antitoxin system